MDSEENGIKQAEKIISRLKAHEDVSWDEMRYAVKLMYQQNLKNFDEIINSRWTWGNKKKYMTLFKALVQITGKASVDLLTIFEQLDGLTKALRILSKQIEMGRKATSELESTLGGLESKLASPKFEKAIEYLNILDEQTAKGKKKRESNTLSNL